MLFLVDADRSGMTGFLLDFWALTFPTGRSTMRRCAGKPGRRRQRAACDREVGPMATDATGPKSREPRPGGVLPQTS